MSATEVSAAAVDVIKGTLDRLENIGGSNESYAVAIASAVLDSGALVTREQYEAVEREALDMGRLRRERLQRLDAAVALLREYPLGAWGGPWNEKRRAFLSEQESQ